MLSVGYFVYQGMLLYKNSEIAVIDGMKRFVVQIGSVEHHLSTRSTSSSSSESVVQSVTQPVIQPVWQAQSVTQSVKNATKFANQSKTETTSNATIQSVPRVMTQPVTQTKPATQPMVQPVTKTTQIIVKLHRLKHLYQSNMMVNQGIKMKWIINRMKV